MPDNKKNPTISILLPTRNTAVFLKKCLNSIIGQTFQSWELLAVNDHSTDESPEILEAYAAKDNRIKVFHATEKGIINGLRLAYENSSGSYITRMDSDDIMPKDKLASMLQLLEVNGPGHLATGMVEYFSDEFLADGYLKYAEWLNQLMASDNPYSEIYKECVIPSPCWMLHRDDFERCEALRPNRYPEDYDLCFRFYKHKIKALPVKQILHYWRDSSGRTSRHDENYADNRFLQLKVDYFVELDYASEQTLVVWGAGKKGKKIALQLKEMSVAFVWVCNNPKKIGKDIYGVKLQSMAYFETAPKTQLIIAVANPDDQNEIKTQLTTSPSFKNASAYFFC